MSAFVIDEATMHRVVQGICARGRYGRIVRQFAGISTDSPGAAIEIGRRLFTLNIEAVMQRYPDCQNDPSHLPGEAGCQHYPQIYLAPALRTGPCGRALLVDSFEAMCCLRYQCSEGDVPEGASLYRELNGAIGAVACEIVQGLPEYEAAGW